MNIQVIKKDGSTEAFNPLKIIQAVNKSADRATIKLSKEEQNQIVQSVLDFCQSEQIETIEVSKLHPIVETAVYGVQPEVAESYRSYRNYKGDFAKILDEVYRQTKTILHQMDNENANSDSALICMKRTFIAGYLMKELYKKFFLNQEEVQAVEDGFIYIHDLTDRLLGSFNCCLFDLDTVLEGGFELAHQWYNEPKTLDVACDVIGDIIMSSSSNQYGGWTCSQVDKTLAKYARKSYIKHKKEIQKEFEELSGHPATDYQFNQIEALAWRRLERELEQGIQGFEIKLNTVASSRGSFPFTTFTFGLVDDEFEKLVAQTILKVRKAGQGKEGHKRPVIFPKLVLLYDEARHGIGQKDEDLFDLAVETCATSMYPDILSLNGFDTVGEMYQKYGEVISPMGCRAYLSPYWRKGGLKPLDETDTPYFNSRANIGAISLNVPMIYMKAKQEEKDFYEVLDYYLEMIRQLHLKTYDYIGKMKASSNPLAFEQGGIDGGFLNPDDEIAPILKSMTASFGITALNELTELHQQTSLLEDSSFALEVMKHINERVTQFKEEDGRLYAVYGTPAESLCGKQCDQFKKKFGEVQNVTTRGYFTNSFHMGVWEDIDPITKQLAEAPFWSLTSGGHIQYVRYHNNHNLEAMKSVIRHGMKLGFYQGTNLALSNCDDCGYSGIDFEICPSCGSDEVTKIDRLCGYIGYSKVKGLSRMNDGKMLEIKDRKSM